MTDEEKRQQKAMLLLEAQEADDELAHLREKATQEAVKLHEVAQWLEDAIGDGYSHDIALKREERERKISTSGHQYSQTMNFANIVDLVHQIKEARKIQGGLQARKAALGLR